MSNVYFTSDQHWFHKLLTRLRGFGEGDEAVHTHNMALMEGWFKAGITDKDVVWVLGDVTVSNGVLDSALTLLSSLPGRKRLIYGNHDPAHPMHKDAFKFAHRYAEVFEWASPFASIRVDKKPVLLSHFPYNLDHTYDARFEQWRLKDMGEFLLHGHTHSSEKVSSPRELHVGVDAWDLKPISLDVVRAFVNREPIE